MPIIPPSWGKTAGTCAPHVVRQCSASLTCALGSFVAGYIAWTVLLLGVITSPAVAQLPDTTGATPERSSDTTTVLHLDRLLEAARTQNPSVLAKREAASAASARVPQVSAWPDPVVGVAVQPYPILTARGAQRTQVRVEQRLPVPGTRSMREESAALQADAAGRVADATADEVALRVRQAFYDLYRAQEEARLVERFRERLRDFEEVATTRYEVGEGSQPSILKAQIERSRLAVRLEQIREEEASARQTLARLMGQAIGDAPAELRRGTAASPDPAPLDTARVLDELGERKPEIRARQRELARAGVQVDLARRSTWPSVTVSATYFDVADRPAPPTADGRDALAIGVGVKIPLDRSRLRGEVDEAEARRRQAQVQLTDARLQARSQAQDLLDRLRSQDRQLDLIRETLIPQAQTTVESTLSAYSAGRTDFLDLLDAERTLFQLQLDRIRTETRRLNTRAALIRAAAL